MEKLVCVILAYANLLSLIRAVHSFCPRNEVLDCINPCEPTCEEPCKIPCPTLVCTWGCVCQPGTIRDTASGECISPEHCPAVVCPTTEIPSNCKEVCEPICPNQSYFVCAFQDRTCICKRGLVRDLKSGQCIGPDKCSPVCEVNAEWNNCTTPNCRRTCQNSFLGDRVCPQVCVPDCECVKGYIWDEYYSACVTENQCSNECNINQEWKSCSDAHCRRTCQNPTFKPCLGICIPGCSCKNDLLWDEKIKQCVAIEECSKLCGENEIWKECSDLSCRDTCQKPYFKWCTGKCGPGCSCVDGYIWDAHCQKCVPRGQCSKVCDENAEWLELLPSNITTCRTLQDSQSKPFGEVVVARLTSGCACKNEFVWEEYSQNCILPSDCPTTIITTTTAPPSGTTGTVTTSD